MGLPHATILMVAAVVFALSKPATSSQFIAETALLDTPRMTCRRGAYAAPPHRGRPWPLSALASPSRPLSPLSLSLQHV
eukprot:8672890-Prorocentrum_lima.AAC.1